MITVSLYHKYRIALDDIAQTSHDRQHITVDAANLAILLAMKELDAAWQERRQPQNEPPALCPNCQNLGQYLDQHESELYNASLSPATTDAITVIERLKDQLIRINDWLAEHAPDEYHQPGDTADAIIAVADTLRGQVAKLRTELAAAIDERNHLDGELRASQNMMNSAHDEAKANAKDAHELRQQLAQLDADNAALIQRNTALAADLATARSYFISRQPTNGHDNTGPLSVSAQSAQSAVGTRSVTQWDDEALLTGLDAATLDYWHGINAGRWTWRKLPKSVRLAMVRHVLSFTETEAPMSMSQFDAFKPNWMPGAGTHPVTFGVTWATLADLRTEIEVPA